MLNLIYDCLCDQYETLMVTDKIVDVLLRTITKYKRKVICTTIRQAQYITIPKTIDISNIKFIDNYLYRGSLIYA